MRTKQLSLLNPKQIAILALAPFFYLTAEAQVKVGSNPTTITSNTNLEVEASDGTKFVVKQGGGNVGIGTANPTERIHSLGPAGHAAKIDSDAGHSHVLIRAAGGISVHRNGPQMGTLPEMGGYVDFVGHAGSPRNWRVSQFQNFFGINNGSDLNLMPFYIHNNGNISIGASSQLTDSPAQLSVVGKIATNSGYATKAGMSGAFDDNNSMFNLQRVSISQVRLWVNNTNYGVITTTSDYRLKKNVTAVASTGLDRVRQLKPVKFEYKEAEKIQHEGFIAHELKAVIPSAVNGEKDALTSDGEIQPQTVNAVPIIAILTKAVQELEEKIVKLESENGQLKASASELNNISTRLAELEAKLAPTKLDNSNSMLSSK